MKIVSWGNFVTVGSKCPALEFFVVMRDENDKLVPFSFVAIKHNSNSYSLYRPENICDIRGLSVFCLTPLGLF